MNRIAGGDGLTAGESTEAAQSPLRVTGTHLNVVWRDTEDFGRELGEHGRGALPLRRGAGCDKDLTRWANPDCHV